MKRHKKIWASTALSLLMAGTSLHGVQAAPRVLDQSISTPASDNRPLILAQQEEEPQGEDQRKRKREGGGEEGQQQERPQRRQQQEAEPQREEQPQRAQRRQQQQEEQQAEPQREEQPQRAQRRQQQQEEQQQAEPQREEQPQRAQRRQQQQEEQQQAEPQREEQPQRAQRRQQQQEEQQAEPQREEQPQRAQRRQQQEEQQQAEPQRETQPDQGEAAQSGAERMRKAREQQEQGNGEQQLERAPNQQQQEEEQKKEEGDQQLERARQQQQDEQQQNEAQGKQQLERARQQQQEGQQGETGAGEGEAQTGADRMRRARDRQQQGEEQATPAQGEAAPTTNEPTEIVQPPVEKKPAQLDNQPAEAQGQRRDRNRQQQGQDGQQADQADVLPENAAPVLDSNKPRRGEDGKVLADQPNRQRRQRDQQQEQQAEPVQLPDSDAAAQVEIRRAEDIRSVRQERGQRIDIDQDAPRRWERPQGVDVVRELQNRVILNFGGQDYVESSDRGRLSRDARDVYYEELPRNRTRETIIRPDGVQVITIRNEYGDVIRRSRIMPDNREYVLYYTDDDSYPSGYRDGGAWQDPGADLPPLRLTIPARDYILDAGSVQDEDRYYDFLDQPPIEPVRRLYSVDEVKRSARIRDTVRRVDLDTITFDTGSYEISDSQIDKLQGVADGMERLLKANPAETFLIEGHTDAVGSAQSNLVLSDQRAESVASALTQYFNIPAENLATQGYGEEYLKINTDGPEQENRRVAIRRITPLVSPATASAQ